MNEPELRFKADDGSEFPGWEELLLEDICEIRTGPFGSTLHASDYVDNGTPIVTTEHFKNGFLPISKSGVPQVSDEDFYRLSTYKLKPGDIVFSRVGSIDINALVTEDQKNWLFSGRVLRVRPDTNINSPFLHYELSAKRVKKSIADRAVGQTMPSINTEILKETQIFVPDKAEQCAIADLFSTLDNVINSVQKEVDSWEQMKRGVMQKLFSQEVRFKADDGSEFPEWEERKLSDVASMHARIGWQNLRTDEFMDDGNYLLITGTDFNNGKVNYDTCHYVSKDRYDQDVHIQVENNTILLTKDGTLGKVALVTNLNMPATLNAGVFAIKTKDESVSPEYLYYWLSAPMLLQYASEMSTGGTIKHLNQKILVDFSVKIPCVEEQQKISDCLSELDSVIEKTKQKLEAYKRLKKGLMQRMFV